MFLGFRIFLYFLVEFLKRFCDFFFFQILFKDIFLTVSALLLD